MEDITAILGLITSAAGVIAIIGSPFLFFYGRKIFAQIGQVVNPAEFEKRLGEWGAHRDNKLEKMSHEIRDAVNGSISRVELGNMQQYQRLHDDIAEIKSGMKETIKKADLAIEKSIEATHKAELAKAAVDANKELVVARLKHIEDSVDNLNRRRRADSA